MGADAFASTQICPLCDFPAAFSPADHGNAKDIRCDRCHSFRITRGAERRLVSEFNLLRELLATEAASRPPEGPALLIDLRPVGDAGHPINSRYVDRAELA